MRRTFNRIAVAVVVLLASSTLVASDGASLVTRIERAAVEAVRAGVSAPDRFEVSGVRVTASDRVDGPVEVRVRAIDGPNGSGRARVELTLVDATGLPQGSALASVQGSRRGPALVARRTLRVGEPIRADHVELTDADLTRSTGEPVRDARALAGLGPLRSLGVGRILTDELVTPLPVVRRNEPIDLVVQRGSLVVRTKGRVRRDAAPGETVVAVNLTSGAEVTGRVRPDGSVLVLRGAVQGRTR